MSKVKVIKGSQTEVNVDNVMDVRFETKRLDASSIIDNIETEAKKIATICSDFRAGTVSSAELRSNTRAWFSAFNKNIQELNEMYPDKYEDFEPETERAEQQVLDLATVKPRSVVVPATANQKVVSDKSSSDEAIAKLAEQVGLLTNIVLADKKQAEKKPAAKKRGRPKKAS